MVGEIKAYGVSARPKSKVDLTSNTVNKLWAEREANNRKFFFSVSGDLNRQEIWDAVTDEVTYGAMTAPTPVASPEDLAWFHADSWSNRSRRNTVSRYRRSDRLTT